MLEKKIFNKLNRLFRAAPVHEIDPRDKLVIFSDLHMGNGSSADDFLTNGVLFSYILKHYYQKNNFKLILNGDIEELQRFSENEICQHWKNIYNIFKQFQEKGHLIKIFGNHDYQLKLKKKSSSKFTINQAIKLFNNQQMIFIFHGHQASLIGNFFNFFSGLLLRFLATPLRIRNYSVAYNNRKRYQIEKRVYDFARKKKIMAIIGHTHRPLFESLSKIDRLKFEIERLCRVYPEAEKQAKISLEKEIRHHKTEFQQLLKKKANRLTETSLYDSGLLVPCLFNSGCGIGKRGITAIEITEGNIKLSYWFNTNISSKYQKKKLYHSKKLNNSEFYRVTLKEEPLDYIFTRILLLS